ncbi:MAG: hypothetical protein ACRDAX_07670 [Propionibacteriaceae bacterium]
MTDIRFHYVTEQQLAELSRPGSSQADEFRALAERRWLSRAARPQRGMLDRLGPLTKNPLLPQTDSGIPAPHDVAELLAGNDLEPARRLAGWRLTDTWLASLASSSARITPSQQEWNGLHSELLAAKTPIAATPKVLLTKEPLPLSLSMLPAMSAGYTNYCDAYQCAQIVATAIPQLTTPHLKLAKELLSALPANKNGGEKTAFAHHLAPILVTLIFS